MDLSDIEELGELQALKAELAELLAAEDVAPLPLPWTREAPLECSSGRTCGLRHSQRRPGVRVAN